MLSNELDGKEVNEIALYHNHSLANNALLTAQAYYLLHEDELNHSEFDIFFKKAAQFDREFVQSRSTNHSMQWTFGYYNELTEAYNELANLIDLKIVKVPE